MKAKKYHIHGLDCPHCAEKLEKKISELEGIESAVLNFETSELSIVYKEEMETAEEMLFHLVKEEEPDAHIHAVHHHDHEHHEHDHEHHAHHHDHEEETAAYLYTITGIDCAACAASLESKIAKIEGIQNVSLNYMKETLSYECAHDEGKAMAEKVKAVVAKEEPDASLVSKGHRHHHDHDHEHQETEIMMTALSHKYTITGIDCADCAAKLEGKLSLIEGISNVNISFLNSTLVFDCREEDLDQKLKAIKALTAKEEPDAVITEIAERGSVRKETEEEQNHAMLFRLIAGAVIFIAGLFLRDNLQIAVMLAAYLILGYDVLVKGVKGIGRGQLFDEHFLMTVATLAAIYLKDFKEAAGVMLFYQIGEYFQDMAVARSRKSIGALMDIRPDHANVKRGEEWIETDPSNVKIGEIIQVRPGEKIPLDGIVLCGASSLDTSSLTGESKPRDVDQGDEVISGSVNQTGLLEIKTTRSFQESTVSKILDLVENQESRKAPQENFITKFSRIYTPVVVFSAIAVAIVTGIMVHDFHEGIYRACTFLVISCPCALVISIPLSFFAGIGGLSSQGVLVKGANLIETLAKVQNVVMDKTGTLTSGHFAVEETLNSSDRNALLEDAAYAECYSNHPIAAGIKEAYGKEVDRSLLKNVEELPGRGLSVQKGEDIILAGNLKLMKENSIDIQEEPDTEGTFVHVAKNGSYEGCIVLSDQLKEDAKEAVRILRSDGHRCMIVSGDSQTITAKTAARLNADGAVGHCLPADKVAYVERLKKEGITAFVGDGVNDAPVIAAADIGIAMGALGSDAAIESADVVIMDDAPSKIAMAIDAAKRILRIANENIYGAIFVKVMTLILGAFGIANLWMAIFADTGVAMLCVMNSLRLLHIARKLS